MLKLIRTKFGNLCTKSSSVNCIKLPTQLMLVFCSFLNNLARILFYFFQFMEVFIVFHINAPVCSDHEAHFLFISAFAFEYLVQKLLPVCCHRKNYTMNLLTCFLFSYEKHWKLSEKGASCCPFCAEELLCSFSIFCKSVF